MLTRQLFLSDGLDKARIAASYDDGVLRLVIPISEAAKPRTIQVTPNAAREQTAVGAGTETGADHERATAGTAG